MTRTISAYSFTDDDPTIGNLTWAFSEHLASHLSGNFAEVIHPLGDSIHVNLNEMVLLCLEGLNRMAQSAWNGDGNIPNGYLAIQLNDDQFGMLNWFPGPNIQFMLNILAGHDEQAFMSAARKLRYSVSACLQYQLMPVCLQSLDCRQCMQVCADLWFGRN